MTPTAPPVQDLAPRTVDVVPEQRRADAAPAVRGLDPHVRRAIALAELSLLAADGS